MLMLVRVTAARAGVVLSQKKNLKEAKITTKEYKKVTAARAGPIWSQRRSKRRNYKASKKCKKDLRRLNMPRSSFVPTSYLNSPEHATGVHISLVRVNSSMKLFTALFTLVSNMFDHMFPVFL